MCIKRSYYIFFFLRIKDVRGKYNSWKELKSLKTEEEKAKWIKNFCDKHGITSPKQLNAEYKGLYMIYFCQLSEENKDIIFPDRVKPDIWLVLKNLETEKEKANWIKNFCDKHEITSPGQLSKKFSRVFDYYCELSEENKDIIFPNRRKNNNWKELKNLETEKEKANWIKNFCDKHGITLPSQLHNNFIGIYSYYKDFSEESKDIAFPNRHKQRSWVELRNLKTEKEQVMWIIDFCDEYRITSPSQLSNEFSQVYKYFCNFSEENKEKVFSPIKSLGEETLGKLLTERGYVFTTQKDFPDLRSDKGGILRYDVYIEQKNCLIEFHGSQHFNPKCKYYSEEGIERDKIKYQYAKDHNIPLFYITDCIEEYEINGYFAPVLIDWNKLMEKIDSIPDVIVGAEDTAQN